MLRNASGNRRGGRRTATKTGQVDAEPDDWPEISRDAGNVGRDDFCAPPITPELRASLFAGESGEMVEGLEDRIRELQKRAAKGLPLFGD